MNCARARALLPALLYGDLPAEEADRVRSHLALCEACRGECGALQRVRHALDALPVPAAAPDLPRLYREAAERQGRRCRRWRRAAVLLAAAGVAAALVLGPSLELRLGPQQVVLRWGAPPPPAVPLPHAPPPREARAVSESAPGEVEERLRLLSDLVQAMAADAELRDGRRQRELTALQAQVRALQQQAARAGTPTEGETGAVDALLSAESEKGASP